MRKQLREKRGLYHLLKYGIFSLPFLLTNLVWSQCMVTTTGGNPNQAGTFANCLTKGQNITFQIGGTFTHAGGLKNHWLTTKDGITIDGSGNHPVLDGSLLNDPAATWKTHTFTINNNNITIKDVKFENAPDNSGWGGAGVIISDGLSNIKFEKCEFNNNTGPGINNSEWNPTGTKGISDLTFTDCKATGNTLSGIQFTRTDNINIDGGEYFANKQSGIYFESAITNGIVNNVKVYNNGLASTGNTDPNVGAGIRVYDGGETVRLQSKTITISNSEIYNNNIHGIELPFDSDEINVFGNEIYKNGYDGTGTATPGNQANGVVFQFGGNDDCTVAENDIHDNRDAGIYMYRIQKNVDHSGNVFYKNTVTDNGGGIIVLGSKSSFIADNVISGTTNQGGVPGGLNGIYFGFNSDDGVVFNNIVKGTVAGNGILVSDDGKGANGSDNVYIFGNTLDDHNQHGIRVENSNNSHIGSTAGAPTIDRDVVGYGNIKIGVANAFGAGAYDPVMKNAITKTIHCIDVFNGQGVEIDGSFIGTSDGATVGTNTGNGINIEECSNIRIGVIEKNIISGNPNGYGIYITKSTDIKIHKNHVGLNEDGNAALGNGKDGIYLDDTDDSEIGDGTDAARNFISGNTGAGIVVSNDASNVKILNNYVGLDYTGLNDLGNGGDGINMTGANKNEVIGNIIAGNNGHGVAVQNAATSENKIQKNTIGLNRSNIKKPNTGDGIYLNNCKNNFIGGVAGEGNTVSGNGGYGISLNGADSDLNKIGSNQIGIDPQTSLYDRGNAKSGIYISTNATNNVIGDNGTDSEGNIISGNDEHGILIDGSTSNKIDGNIIGMNDQLNQAHKNGVNCPTCAGIYITNNASNNEIGVVKKNTIAGDHPNQILIDGGANGNKIQNNDIGIDNTVITNGEATQVAIRISGAGTDNNEIGLAQAQGNLITHSSNQAVLINQGAKGNKVSGNTFVGSAGSSPESAVLIDGASENIIGGTNDDTGNTISKTTANAITVKGNSDANQIQTNYVGVNKDGTTAVGPVKGHGIVLEGSGVSNTLVFNNRIGMLDDATKNAIYVNGITGTSEIYGNYLGITKKGTDIANAGHGVLIEGSATGVSIGKAGSNPNIIANSAKTAVEITNSTNTTIINNYIGTNVAGDAAKANTGEGVHVGTGNSSVTISDNVISGNTEHGILVDNNVTGSSTISGNKIGFNASADAALFPNAKHAIKFDGFSNTGTTFTVSGNEIGGHTVNAVEVVSSENVTFSGNFIGTNATGTTAFANTEHGIHLGTGAGNITINNGNVISGNTKSGIFIDVVLGGTNTIDGNTIGMNSAKTGALGNGEHGIAVTGNTGTLTISGNSIGGNTNGIDLDASTGTAISGNFIGIGDANANVGNTANGINIANASNTTQITAANKIGFNVNGINVNASTGAVIQGNHIGSDGTTTNFGNTNHGIVLEAASNDADISGDNKIDNNVNGIQIDASTGTTITGNVIGHEKAISATQVQKIGINLVNGAASSSISTNTIASNETDGIIIDDASSNQNTISQNSMTCNGPSSNFGDGTGITLSNSGNNNFATGISAVVPDMKLKDSQLAGNGSVSIDISGYTGVATVEIFQNDTDCDNCQGKTYLGNATITGTTATYDLGQSFTDPLVCDDYVVTITDTDGNTSQFSKCSGCNCTDPQDNPQYHADTKALDDFAAGTVKTCFPNKITLRADEDTSEPGTDFFYSWFKGDPTANATTWIKIKDAVQNDFTVTIDSTTTDQGSGTYFFVVSYTNDVSSCSKISDPITLKFNPSYDPTITAISYCKDETVVAGSLAAQVTATNSGTINWYTASTGGTGSTSEPSVTTTTAGNTSYYVSETVNNCEGNRVELVVTVKDVVSPTVTASAICDGDAVTATTLSSQVTATNAGTINWYTASTGGTGSTTAPTPGNTATGGTAATESHFVTETVDGCEGPRVELTHTVNPLPSITFANLADVCGSDSPVTLNTATPTGGTYSIGGSAATQFDPSGKSGSTTITYNYTDANSCSNSGTADINVTPVVQPTTTAISYCKDETVAGGSLIAQVTAANAGTINWYTVSTGGTGSTSAPAVTTTTAGNTSYYVSETVNNCEGNRVELVVTVKDLFSPAITASTICDGDAVSGTTLSSKVTAGNGGTLNWYTASTGGTGSTSAPTPSNTTGSTATSESHYISETVDGCEGPRVELTHTINPLPSITFANLADICDSDNSVTLNTATPAGGTYSIGGSTVTQFDPSGKSGTTTITYNYTDANSCSNSGTADINVVSAAKVTITGDGTSICEGDPAVQLIASGATIYTWDADASLSTTSGALVSATPTTTTTYTVNTKDANNCPNTAKATITVNQKPIITSSNVNYCEGSSTSVKASGAQNYEWFPSIGLESNTGATVTASAGPIGSMTYTIEGTDANGCVGSTTVDVEVNHIPVAVLTLPDKICFDDAYTAIGENKNPQATGVTEVWTFNGNTIDKSQTSWTSDQTKESGTYQVTMTSDKGCSHTSEELSIIITTPKAEITVVSGRADIKEGETVTLVANGGATDHAYSWQDNLGGNTLAENQITLSPTEDIVYTLTATKEGCVATTSQEIKVRSQIVIPNGFSPNGDGLNEVWTIKNIEDYEAAIVKVYNRWGNLIYESTPGYKTPWSGIRESGNKMPIATYYYIVELNDVDNQEYAGSVTIVK